MSSIPKIRFKGFTDDWEHRKLGDALVSLQNNTLSRADLSNESGVAKIYIMVMCLSNLEKF